jgi:ubiquinone/menaquinone biosynthesis C-methylase UbiE
MAGMDKGERMAGAEMTGTRELYDEWAATYDSVDNPTRDLEKRACESVLGAMSFGTAIEIGGGTGKNTAWLAERAKRLISVDLSPEMQAIANQKVQTDNVEFRIGDITAQWDFAEPADLITCSLILEHVEDLHHVFREAAKLMKPGGRFYVCELHPFKQYAGSKARFETDEGLKVLECFMHHLTDYTDSAMSNGFAIERMNEWFDAADRDKIPRLISFLFIRNM